MGESNPSRSDGESRAPRPHRSQPRSDHRGTRDDNPKTHNGKAQDKDERHSRDYNERHDRKSHAERGPERYQERDRYHEGRSERSHRDVSGDRHHDTDQYHGERNTSRNQRDRRDQYPKDREHGKPRQERSHDRYEESKPYRSPEERSHNQYVEWDTQYKGREDRDKYHERDWHPHAADKPQRHPMDIRDQERSHKAERSFSSREAPMSDVEYYETESDGGILNCNKCRYLCTGRGILLMVEAALNALVLICIVASHFVLSGFSAGMASGGFGGGYYPFEGQELQQVRELDQQMTLLRAPLLYGGLTVAVLMGALTLAVLAAGSKPLPRLSEKWLLAEASFCALGSLGYAAAVGVFLHFALQINSTDVCKKRERLYARNGLTSMNCDLAGTDGGAAAFGILLVILYGAGVVLTFRVYRERKFYLGSESSH